ncbi:MAG TPA: rhomboid family intramembrane serine protease [Saprospiraceae bacterium]|nr:rhomboid family intramembrane serine protease [Saprospiraceae bacterium]
MLQITPVVKQLLIINIVIFVLSMVMAQVADIDPNALALYYPGSPNFRPYQIVTHFFMHAGLAHIFFNMFALFMFGSALEAKWGPKRFLFFYFFCAIGAAALHTGYVHYHVSGLENAEMAFRNNPDPTTFHNFFDKIPANHFSKEGKDWLIDTESALQSQTNPGVAAEAQKVMDEFISEEKNTAAVGASGAIYGLLLAFGMLFPNVKLMLIFFPVPIAAKYFIPFMMLLELFLGVNHFSWDNIAHFAHLGGALFGLLLILYWRKFDDSYRAN